MRQKPVIGIVAFTSWLGILLTFLLGFWPSSEALAVTASPSALTFQAGQTGSSPSSQPVTVSKSNSKTTNYTVSSSARWVSVSPLTGNIRSTAQIAVTANTAGLAAGTYAATVTVTISQGGSISIPVTVIVAASAATPASNTASLSWNPPNAATVSGYRVYMGTSSGVYGTPFNVGNVTSYTVNNLATGTYYFVITDYDATGAESPPSNEVSKTIY